MIHKSAYRLNKGLVGLLGSMAFMGCSAELGSEFYTTTERDSEFDTIAELDSELDATDDLIEPAAAKLVPGALPGQIVVNPDNKRFLVFNRDNNNDGRLDEYFLAGVGGPEGFLFAGKARQREIIGRLKSSDVNGIYFQAVRSSVFGGDGGKNESPFNVRQDPNSGVDQGLLDEWEELLAELDNAGVTLFFFLYDDHVAPWGCGSANVGNQERNFVKAIVERFMHHRNLIWITQEEWRFCKTKVAQSVRKQKQWNLVALIRQFDDFDHPIAVHHMNGQRMQFADDPNIDIYAQQAGSKNGFVGVDGMHDNAGVDAGFDEAGRFVYIMAEAHPFHKNLLKDGDRKTLRLSNWAIAMAGGYLMMYDSFEQTDPTNQMLNDLRRLNNFMEATTFNQMAPRDDLAFGGTKWALANRGIDSYILYNNNTPNNLNRVTLVVRHKRGKAEARSPRSVHEVREQAPEPTTPHRAVDHNQGDTVQDHLDCDPMTWTV